MIRMILKNAFGQVMRLRRTVWVIYVCNLTLAAAAALPLFVFFHKELGHLPARAEMSTGFSYSWWSAFNSRAEGLAATISPVLSSGFGMLFGNLELLLTGNWTGLGLTFFLLGLIYVFLAAFFNGGFTALATEDKPFTLQRFFSQSALFFRHTAALATTLILLLWAIYKGLSPLVFSLIDRITANSFSQPFVWTMNLIGYLLLFKVLFIVTLIFDYARTILIIKKMNSAWASVLAAAIFVFRHGRAFVLNALLLLIAAGVTVCGTALFSAVRGTETWSLVTLFLLQQTFMLLMIAVRLSFYAAEVDFYQQSMNAEQVVRKRRL